MSLDIDFMAAWGAPNNDRRGNVMDMLHTQDFIANLRYPYRGDGISEDAYFAACFPYPRPSIARVRAYVKESQTAFESTEQKNPSPFLSSNSSSKSEGAWLTQPSSFHAVEQCSRTAGRGRAIHPDPPMTVVQAKLVDHHQEVQGMLGQRWLPKEGLSTDIYVAYLDRHLSYARARQVLSRSTSFADASELASNSNDPSPLREASESRLTTDHECANLEAAWRSEVQDVFPGCISNEVSLPLPGSNLTPEVIALFEESARRKHAVQTSRQLQRGFDSGASSVLQQCANAMDATLAPGEGENLLRAFPDPYLGGGEQQQTLTPEAAATRAAREQVQKATATACTVSAFLSSVDPSVSGGMRTAAARKRYWAPRERKELRKGGDQFIRGSSPTSPSCSAVTISLMHQPHVLKTEMLLKARHALRERHSKVRGRRDADDRIAPRRPSSSSKGGTAPRTTSRTPNMVVASRTPRTPHGSDSARTAGIRQHSDLHRYDGIGTTRRGLGSRGNAGGLDV